MMSLRNIRLSDIASVLGFLLFTSARPMDEDILPDFVSSLDPTKADNPHLFQDTLTKKHVSQYYDQTRNHYESGQDHSHVCYGQAVYHPDFQTHCRGFDQSSLNFAQDVSRNVEPSYSDAGLAYGQQPVYRSIVSREQENMQSLGRDGHHAHQAHMGSSSSRQMMSDSEPNPHSQQATINVKSLKFDKLYQIECTSDIIRTRKMLPLVNAFIAQLESLLETHRQLATLRAHWSSEYRFNTLPIGLRRPKKANQEKYFIQMISEEKKWMAKEVLYTRLRKLLAVIMFHHEVFLRDNLSLLGEESDQVYQENLFMWLRKVFFDPVDSYPVIGLVPANTECNPGFFQKPQFHFIRGISSGQINTLDPIATDLILIFYKGGGSSYYLPTIAADVGKKPCGAE